MAIKTFSAGSVLTASDTNTYLANAGLVYVTQVTVGSGVSSVTVSNCFSSTYENYLVVFSGISGSVSNAPMGIQLNNSTGNVYSSNSAYMVYGSAGFNGYASGTTSKANLFWSDTTSDMNVAVKVFSPYLAKYTTFNTEGANQTIVYTSGAKCADGVSSTGFTLSGDTLTGGTISVYGYRKA